LRPTAPTLNDPTNPIQSQELSKPSAAKAPQKSCQLKEALMVLLMFD